MQMVLCILGIGKIVSGMVMECINHVMAECKMVIGKTEKSILE